MYLRSSYRTKQYPTLSTRQSGPVKAVWSQEAADHQHHRAQTLPGPFKNRFDANSGCDSPVGLYNCPQQRTSQAFSSLDDLDGLAGMGPPPSRRPDTASHYPSLERSARKKQSHASSAAIMEPTAKVESRSMENLEVLENAGARGSARARGRGPVADTLAAREKALDDLVYRTNKTTLKNTDEYPSTTAGFDDVDGSYPALPLPARRTTLLPGQTYPEPVSAGPNLLTHSHTVSSLRDALATPTASRLISNFNHTYTVHARKVETTFGLNDSVRTHSVIASDNESPKLPQRLNAGDEVKPPLFPKQFYNKQRHSVNSLHDNSESPAVPRKLKPSPASQSPAHSLPNQSAQLNESNTSFDTVASGDGGGVAGGGGASNPPPPSFQPYRETSKPFEMADFYKYSTKFRKASASSLRSTESDSPHVLGSESPRSGSGSQRSSTSRESVPPELPTKPGTGTVSAVPAVARLPAAGKEESLADAFSTEMLAWYEQKQTTKAGAAAANSSGKPATLV